MQGIATFKQTPFTLIFLFVLQFLSDNILKEKCVADD